MTHTVIGGCAGDSPLARAASAAISRGGGNLPNWDDYRILFTVSETGSFAAAARSLGVSQPTVSRRMTELERQLGVCLFDRTPDGQRVSEAGTLICRQVRLLAQQAARIEMTARDGGPAGHDRVRVTASEGIAQAIVTPVISRLREGSASLGIDLIVTPRAADVRRHEADVAVRIGEPLDQALVGRRVGIAYFALYAQDEYLAIHGVPRTPEDLELHSIIESTGEIAHLPQATWLRANASSAKVTYSSNSILNQIGALQRGMGILALPTYLGTDLHGVRRVLSQHYNPTIDVWMLTEQSRREAPEVRAVLDLFAREIPRLLDRIADSQPVAAIQA